VRGSSVCLARLAALLRIILHLQGQAVRLGLYSAPAQQLCIGLVSTLLMRRELILIFTVMRMFLLALFVGLCEGKISQIISLLYGLLYVFSNFVSSVYIMRTYHDLL
jgi:hypothetical protein